MPTRRISFSNWNRRLFVAGGREQVPPGSLRRAVGVAPESVNSILSRWGSQQLYAINAISLYRFNGKRYAYDGTNLYENGVSIKPGFTGGRLTFVTMPPQPGQPDYLFVLGGGLAPFKISPTGTISNWGIQPPRDGMQALVGATDSLTIDTFVASALNWTGTRATVADNSTIPFGGAASCLAVAPTNTQAQTYLITRTYGSVQNFAYYGDGRASLQTDLISFYVWMADPTKFLYLSLQFDVNDGTFTDYYVANVQFVPGAVDPGLTGGIAQVVQADGGRWTKVALAKSQFLRVGGHLNLDWSTVKAVRFQGGLPYGGVGTFSFALQNLKMTGGFGLGTGPAAASGGSVYLYQVTFGNETTGSDSNPNLQPAVANAVAESSVVLRNIPTSTSDTQVGNRKLWRSQALPLGSVSGPLFFLDKISDNATTTYTDVFADIATPYTVTPWVATAAYILNQLIDPGNGWLMKCTTAGTTGATQPAWNIPGGYWIPLEANFTVGDTIFDIASGFVMQCTTAGLTGNVVPNFGGLAVGGTLTDGTVVWTRIAAPTTTDGSATWTFAGINSPPILGNQEVLLDNAAPDPTVGDAAGPWQNSMVWTRVGNFPGDVFISPPGRPESFGGAQIHVTSVDDPTQKAVVWDVGLWLLSTKRAIQLAGTFPAIAPNDVNAGLGTITPYAVVPVQKVGILYNSTDGIRLLSFAGSQLVGFEAIAPLLRGQTEEGIPAFSPVWAALGRDEVYFGDNTTTLALEYTGEGVAWREIGLPMLAAFYERDTGSVLASWGGNVLLYEQPGQLTDGGTAIPFRIQSPGDMADAGAQFQTQRLYLTVQLNGQTLTPVLIVDGTSHTLPVLVGTGRQTFELPKQISGRLFDGIQLIGSLTARIEVFRLEADVWLG